MTADKSVPPKKPLPDDEVEDRTLIAPSSPLTSSKGSDADAELQPTGNEDSHRTLLFQDADVAAPVEEPLSDDDADRTLLAPMPMPVAKPAQLSGTEPDRTVIATQTDTSEGGSTYRPSDDGTTPPVSMQSTSVSGDAAAGGIRAGNLTNSISTGPTHAPAVPGPLRTLEPGAVINNMYRVEERIDHGGMGRVFRGIEIGTGESVAIKVILPEMAEDPRVAQMFRREARTLRQLHHDAIVRYFAYVPPDANFNLHALVMGFIEGTKLSDKIKGEGPLNEKQTCNLFLRLAAGLERAHQIGIVHRDLSPDNVMLPDNDIAKALLIDFGISRSSKVKDVTLGNEFAGKLKYVSPEQLGAYGGEADAPSDVYSFALLMIVALTGKALAMGDSIVEAVQMRQSVPDLREVPLKFQSLLYQMLQPDPAVRMKSMEQVIAELRAIQGGGSATFGGVTEFPNNRAVAGLQAAPRASQTGLGFVTSAPVALPQAEPERTSGAFGKILGVFLFCAALGGIGLLAVGSNATDVAASDPADETGLTRIPGTRETFLAEMVTAPCTYASLATVGQNAGLIQGFAPRSGTIGEIGAQFETAFGMRPDSVTRTVEMPQCAALDFAHTLQGTSGAPVEMTLDLTRVARSEGVVGTIHDSGAGRQNWLALVSPTGRVFSLMKQLAEPIGGQRQFSFRLPSAEPGVYVLIATASNDALVRAGAMVDGTQAADVLPLMIRELSQDGQGAVGIAAIEITR